ncbi:MAG: hypothetical protein Q9163_001284 [Psora crenata]
MASTLVPSLPKPLQVLRTGGISVVYEVSDSIVLKRPTVEGQAGLVRENRIFGILAKHPPCPEPENILLNDRSHLKIADFDCTDVIGARFEACIPPYGRVLGSEAGPGEGTAGKLGARTEQFALGSIFYYINYGLEVYYNLHMDDGPMVVELLQRKVFPELTKYPTIDSIIRDCWHGKFETIGKLSKLISIQLNSGYETSTSVSEAEFATKRNLCLQLLDEGILDACPLEEDYSGPTQRRNWPRGDNGREKGPLVINNLPSRSDSEQEVY